MRVRTQRLLGVVLGAVAGFSTAGCALSGSTVANAEFGFSASIPAGFPDCSGKSGTNGRGIYLDFSGEGCAGASDDYGLSLWADDNASFHADALDFLRLDPDCGEPRSFWATAEWKDSVAGLRTAFCRVEYANGRLEITLVAQRGRVAEGNDVYPRYFYTVSLVTTTARARRDVELLRTFVRSIRLLEVDAER